MLIFSVLFKNFDSGSVDHNVVLWVAHRTCSALQYTSSIQKNVLPSFIDTLKATLRLIYKNNKKNILILLNPSLISECEEETRSLRQGVCHEYYLLYIATNNVCTSKINQKVTSTRTLIPNITPHRKRKIQIVLFRGRFGDILMASSQASFQGSSSHHRSYGLRMHCPRLRWEFSSSSSSNSQAEDIIYTTHKYDFKTFRRIRLINY